MQVVPIGVVGELYIGGIQVAAGYLKNPEKTGQSFVMNPNDATIMYKTGDLAKLLPDGNVIYVGREDFQVKIRGIR